MIYYVIISSTLVVCRRNFGFQLGKVFLMAGIIDGHWNAMLYS